MTSYGLVCFTSVPIFQIFYNIVLRSHHATQPFRISHPQCPEGKTLKIIILVDKTDSRIIDSCLWQQFIPCGLLIEIKFLDHSHQKLR